MPRKAKVAPEPRQRECGWADPARARPPLPSLWIHSRIDLDEYELIPRSALSGEDFAAAWLEEQTSGLLSMTLRRTVVAALLDNNPDNIGLKQEARAGRSLPLTMRCST